MNPYEGATQEAATSPSAVKSGLTLGTILGRLLISAISWSIHCLVTGGLLFVFVVVIPMAKQDLEEFELDLPAISDWVFGISSLFIHYWYLLVVALVIIDLPIAITVCYLDQKYQWVTWVWFTSYLLIAFFLVVVACPGGILPFVNVMFSLSVIHLA
ncbi:hypothetical protein [Blastopirellula marina]|uniref:Uncharacterized protein n=1 Tax=Blastopirellula marina TaxID=124 RepID=A0A2S8G0K6_9BACT|nr:hypothetical protein [Blastopirellula marina]PQO37979.1 hypothetical protein C5Y98_07775 [Blastopirellula marina]PTL44635.1 hypothetical protein C5Y97_07775 [Blastopirellula marina]